MSTRALYLVYVATVAVISLPFTVIHLVAKPDDAPITPLQHWVAAVANWLGPWGVTLVRLVDFPNAGLRSFNWVLAAGLTVVGVGLALLPLRIRQGIAQYLLAVSWAVFAVVWFAIGLTQIADGLL